MKKLLTILFLTLSFSSFAEIKSVMDTISNWQVYNGRKLPKAFNSFSKNNRIVLPKGQIKAIDVLSVRYFDDTPCANCNATISIKTIENKTIKIIDNTISNYDFEIKTTDLQVLAFKYNSNILKFYYKENSTETEALLFEIEIK